MQLFRRSALSLVGALFITSLVAFGFTLALLQVFGRADSVKGALARSGIYDSVVSGALEQFQNSQQGTAASTDIPLDKPEIQNVIKDAAAPELLQAKAENAIDSWYAWLHGDTPTLTFNIEMGDVRANLANRLEQYVAQHVAALPVCAPGAVGNAVDDPFAATCRPDGVGASQIATNAKLEFLGSEFLQDSTINADNITIGEGKTLADRFENAPSLYKTIAWSVYGSGLLALVLAVGVVLLSQHWRAGVKRAAIVCIIIGAVSIIGAQLVGYGMSRASEYAKKPLEQSALKVGDELLGSLRNWWMGYGIVLVVVGTGALVALRFTKPQTPGTEPAEDKPVDEEIAITGAAPTPPGAPRPVLKPRPPKPVKKLVQ